jgi:hypothetical protein
MANGPEDFWPDFGGNLTPPDITCEGTGSLAYRVLRAFDIPCGDVIGGDLPDLDIKHMDAIQIIKLSLLQESADTGQLYEPIMDATGEVMFKPIGYSGGNVSDIYYEIQTGTYNEECSGVVVVGRDPLAHRREAEWKEIWAGGTKQIFDAGFLFSSCSNPHYNQYAVIVFDDPHLNSEYEDGIDNLYEITRDNPYDTITGYAYYMSWPGWESDSTTTVTLSDSAKILIEIEEVTLGKLRKRPIVDPRWGEEPACFEGTQDSVSAEGGVPIPLPEAFRFDSVRGTVVDKFTGVVGVYVSGFPIKYLKGKPISNSAAAKENPTGEDTYCEISIDQTYESVFSLDEGKHYVVAYAEGTEYASPVIVFADNLRPGDPLKIDGENPTHYKVAPNCEYAVNTDGLPRTEGDGYILPTGPSSGFLVNQIFVGVELETPSIIIYNPDGINNKATEIANSLTYQVAPIITVDEPPPIAFNGTLVDQTSAIVDHDPTTTQNFEDTEMEKVLDQMDAGGGMTLNLSFLDENQVVRLSGALYDYMNSGSGVESAYICGPNCQPDLGGLGPNGGVINAINYSYQDSNSYTISVNCGPKLIGGMSQVSGGPSPKATESFSAKGTVIQDEGNNVYFKVRVDGFKDVTAVNMCPKVIRVGDKVNVSIHNNPVEE